MTKLMHIVNSFIGECWHGQFNRDCITGLLSPNCLHQKTIGKCIGVDSFISDCYDWSYAFPDYNTEIKSIEEYRNIVICDVHRSGTHMNRYASSNFDKKSILTISDFFLGIDKIEPAGVSYHQPAKLIFAFEQDKISQIIIEEDPGGLIEQLNIQPHRNSKSTEVTKESQLAFASNAINRILREDLTTREIQCLALGFCGFSSKHMAEILKISYRTAETHLHNSYQKLGCFGKQQALDLMHEKQLITLWLDLGKLLLVSV